jgi:hypothetical protein
MFLRSLPLNWDVMLLHVRTLRGVIARRLLILKTFRIEPTSVSLLDFLNATSYGCDVSLGNNCFCGDLPGCEIPEEVGG